MYTKISVTTQEHSMDLTDKPRKELQLEEEGETKTGDRHMEIGCYQVEKELLYLFHSF